MSGPAEEAAKLCRELTNIWKVVPMDKVNVAVMAALGIIFSAVKGAVVELLLPVQNVCGI